MLGMQVDLVVAELVLEAAGSNEEPAKVSFYELRRRPKLSLCKHGAI